jgi:ABC-2 type transport system ATP-binding protein
VSSTPALEVTGLTVRYGKRVAVDGLSLVVEPGEIVAMLGPNGAGKSTALAAVAGVLRPSAGSVRVGGIDVAADPIGGRAQIGFADQPPALYEFFTAAEHLEFVASTRGDADPAGRTRLLDALGLAVHAARLCRELSFGMRQRLGLAAALVGGTRLILLDETLNGLDPRAGKAAREVVAAAAEQGAAVVMSTHLLGVAERLCTRLIVMDRAKLRADVGGEELRALVARGAGAIEELYLSLVDEGETA